MAYFTKKGFTLVELSIVIIIIGLLAAGISSGKNLIEQSKLVTYTSDIGKYLTAVNQFRARFDYLPGDFPHAQSYWGTALLYAGDGDGIINIGSFAEVNCNNTGENQLAWTHLGEAQLINKKYPAVDVNPIAGINVPQAPGPATYALSYSTLVSGNAIWITSVRPYGWYRSCTTTGAGLTTNQAHALDLKSDDGKSNSGKIKALHGLLANEQAPSEPCISSSEYNFSSSIRNCLLIQKFD